jgi:hypothetical protein
MLLQRRLAGLAIIVVLVAAAVVAGPRAAHAGPVKVATGVTIFSMFKGRCLDADAGAIGANGTKVQLWDCNGWPNQTWDIFSDGAVRSTQSGRCLDADLGSVGANGTKVQLWDCTGGANQKWNTLLSSLTAPAGVGPLDSSNLRSAANGRCLDADLGSIWANGTKVQLWDCNSWTNQRWHASNQAFDTSAGRLRDAGFEGQPGPGLGAPWASEGLDFKGVDRGNGQAHAGANNAFIRAGSRSWNAITQHVPLLTDRRYRLQAWVRTTGNVTTGVIGVRGGQGTRSLAQTAFGPGGYQFVTVEFNSRYYPDATVFIGYTAPGADSWIQVDDVYIAPEDLNWAGYTVFQSVHTPDQITAVHARWTEPVFPCPRLTDEVAMWVGIDGIAGADDDTTPPRLPHAIGHSPSLVQVGTDASCRSGSLHHQAWFEVVDPDGGHGTNGTQFLGGIVMAGDHLEAWVTSHPDPDTSGTTRLFDMTIANTTRNWTATIPGWHLPDATNQTGDVVIESPSVHPVAATWPDLSLDPIAFTDATVNGRSLGDYGPLAVYAGGHEPTPINASQSAFSVGLPVARPSDAGFEGQPAVGGIAVPWTGEGPDFKGIDRGGLAHTGTNNAFIRTASGRWNAVTQLINVEANSTYRLRAWVRTSGNVTAGLVGARQPDTGTVLGMVGFTATAGYQQVTDTFNSGPNTTVRIFIGYASPLADSWIQIDDVLVTPA